MQKFKHLVIVAGEESGDAHAAHFIRSLKIQDPDLKITGFGGQHMESAGAEVILHLARFGITGLSGVLKHFKLIKQAFSTIQTHLKDNKPDLLVLVDYPGFNLRLAKFAKETLGIRILYYISPQIWAWKAGRIHTIKKYVDRMAVIFPFEHELYKKAKVPVTFVGHPLVEKLTHQTQASSLKAELNFPLEQKIVALLPGSRMSEIKYHMPVMVETAQKLLKTHPQLHFIIPVAQTINLIVLKKYLQDAEIPFTIVAGQAIETMQISDCVIVASGTASLECALLEKPMCIIYKGSTLSYLIASQVIKVRYLGLCNLLENRMIVPELLQYDCNPTELSAIISKLLFEPQTIHSMQKRLGKLRSSLSTHQAETTISQLIYSELSISTQS